VLAATPDGSALEREALRQDVLDSEIDRLRRDLALRQNECRSLAARPPEPPIDEGAPDRRADSAGPGVTEVPDADERDRTFDERVEREGGETGAMNISLAWQGPSDLDLVVQCPSGEVIDYQHTSACGGRLQIDMNSRANTMSETPIEDVVWPEGYVQPGSYRVGVRLYKRVGASGPIPFQVRVTIGEEQQFFDGSVANDRDLADVTTVQIP
jgi:hypothetical protein